MSSPRPSAAAILTFAGTTVVGVALDLWTKAVAFQKLALGVIRTPDGVVRAIPRDAYTLVPGWLELEVTANQGAVFGLGQGKRIIFIVVSAGAICFLTYLFVTGKRRWWYQVVLGMLLAGVLGNMYDRVFLGYVRDMIHALPQWPRAFPWIFNVADTLLCTGVFLMLVDYYFTSVRRAEPRLEPGA